MKFHKDGTLPNTGEIFVFGSNLAGIHGAGAAKVAVEKFGAKYKIAKGMCGLTYAIPTKSRSIDTLPLDQVETYVGEFVNYTRLIQELNLQFFVTRVGCGLAGYKDYQIAPMFKGAVNCSFAEEWRPFLED